MDGFVDHQDCAFRYRFCSDGVTWMMESNRRERRTEVRKKDKNRSCKGLFYNFKLMRENINQY